VNKKKEEVMMDLRASDIKLLSLTIISHYIFAFHVFHVPIECERRKREREREREELKYDNSRIHLTVIILCSLHSLLKGT
jgi:hypothetical protein